MIDSVKIAATCGITPATCEDLATSGPRRTFSAPSPVAGSVSSPAESSSNGGERGIEPAPSEYRFAHVLWIAAGVLLWWSLRSPEARAPVTRAILVVVALGGLGRLISIAWTGWPHPVFIGALVLELVVLPLVLLWHRQVFPPRRQR